MPQYIADLLSTYGYVIIFLGVMLENAGVPAPGHTVLLAGAFLAQSGRLSLPLVIATAAVAAIIGDNLGFWMGRRKGRGFIARHRRLLHLGEDRQRRLEAFFEQHGAKTVFIARFITGLQTVAVLCVGEVKSAPTIA